MRSNRWWNIAKLKNLDDLPTDIYGKYIVIMLVLKYNSFAYPKSFYDDFTHRIELPFKINEILATMSEIKCKRSMKSLKESGIINFTSGSYGYKVDIITEPIVSRILDDKALYSVEDLLSSKSVSIILKHSNKLGTCVETTTGS
jgi:hypothetical protein